MFDLHSNSKAALLFVDSSVTATAYSDYVDRKGYESVEFIVAAGMTTADGSNYILPSLLGATATPAASGSYTALADNDLNGAFSALNDTTDTIQQVGYAGADNHYRYLCVLLTETGTADADELVVIALLHRGGDKPISSDTITTGTVT